MLRFATRCLLRVSSEILAYQRLLTGRGFPYPHVLRWQRSRVSR